MRVLMTADAVGGVWNYAVDLARALRPLGVDVHLATMGTFPSAEQLREARAVCASIHPSSFALEWEEEPWDDVDEAGAWLLDLADEIEPDLVHLNGYAHGALPWSVPAVVAAHSDVFSWWRAVRGCEAPSRERYRDAVNAGLAAAKAILVPTRAVANDLAAHYRLRTGPVVVPNGRDLVPRIGAKEPFVLAVGRFWDPAKNLEAIRRIEPHLDWPVIAVGPGTPRGSLPQPELEDLRSRAAVFCAPVRYEPFGLAILEAGFAGCALVLGDIPSLREVWHDAAVFVPPDDDDQLLAALRLVIRDERLRRDLGRRACARAARYDAAQMAQRIADVYDVVLEPNGVAA
jgi:glycosyltransferase involved in cell wall biosynthesis